MRRAAAARSEGLVDIALTAFDCSGSGRRRAEGIALGALRCATMPLWATERRGWAQAMAAGRRISRRVFVHGVGGTALMLAAGARAAPGDDASHAAVLR